MSYVLANRLGLQDDEERQQRPTSFSATTAPAVQTQAQQSAQPQPQGAAPDAYQGGSGWVNLQKYLGANQGQGQQMAESLAGDVQKQGQAFQQGLSNLQTEQENAAVKAGPGKVAFGSLAEMPKFGEVAGQADKASQQAKQLVDFSGRKDLLAQQAQSQGAKDYSSGMGRWDSFLSGAAGGGVLKQTADNYGGLSDALNLANQQSAAVGLNSQIAPPAQLAAPAQAAHPILDWINSGPASRAEWFNGASDGGKQAAIEAQFGPGSWEKYLSEAAANKKRNQQMISATLGGR